MVIRVDCPKCGVEKDYIIHDDYKLIQIRHCPHCESDIGFKYRCERHLQVYSLDMELKAERRIADER